MKINFEKIIKISIGAVIPISILVPSLILSQNNGGLENFCEQLSTIYSTKVKERKIASDGIEERRAEISDRITKNQTELDANIAEKREIWDTRREEQFAGLKKIVRGNEKEAVAKFIETVENAITIRRNTIDSAIQNFRKGFQEETVSYQTAIDAKIIISGNIIGHFEKGLADCENGVSPTIIKQGLESSIPQLSEAYNSSTEKIQDVKKSTALLIKTKRETIKKATDEFEATIEKASAELKAVFNQ